MENLTELESRLLEACRYGHPLVCTAPKNSIRADEVRALSLGLQHECPAPRGVQIKGATILGQLDLQDHLIAARLILDECVLADGINACFATILLMDLSGSRLGSLLAARAHVKHNLILGGVAVLHRVDLRQAVIEGQLYADELRITGAPGTVALRGDGIRVDGDIFLRRSEIHGEARFPAAQVGGNFECDGAQFMNPGQVALNIEGVTVGKSIFLRAYRTNLSEEPFHCNGEVRLLGGRVGDEMCCQGGVFSNPNGLALTCDRLRVGGSVFLIDGFHSTGEVRFAGARIGSDLTLRGALLDSASGNALYAVDADVEGVLRLNALASKPRGRINLDHANAHAFVDDEASWPDMGMLEINGFSYDDLGQTSPTRATTRLKWLRLQPHSPFRAHPYEQIAKVLRAMGNMSDARAILVAKHKDLRAYGKLRNSERFANWFWGVTIGHGYAPGRVCFWIVGWVFFGWLCYLLAYGYGVLTPSGTTHEGLVPLQLFLLATDKFLPGGDLGQAAGWQVDPDGVASSVVHALERAYRLVGWFFTAIAAAALVGLLKKE